jgi:hypothetical protein
MKAENIYEYFKILIIMPVLSEWSIEANREVSLEVNSEKANCMFMSLHQNEGQNQYADS